MRLFKFSFTLFLFFVLFSVPFFSHATAETSTPSQAVASNVASGALVASVNIENAHIIKQEKNTFLIDFTLANGKGSQTGVKYGVQLIPESGKIIADEKVYAESLFLAENTKVLKEITYIAPSNLSGNYSIYIVSKTDTSFPLGIALSGKVKLVATANNLAIAQDSCYLKVQGEKGNIHYSLSQNVDISATESLELTCTATNGTAQSVTVTPSFETHETSMYGKAVPQSGGTTSALMFKKGEKQTFTLGLPKVVGSQLYMTSVKLVSKEVTSNAITLAYQIRGATAKIYSVSLDKDMYKAGDKGEMSLLWSASAGNSARNPLDLTTVMPDVVFSGTVSSGSQECIEPILKSLVRDPESVSTKIPFEVKMRCTNPQVSLTLKDANGTVLDQKEFSFKSTSFDEDNSRPHMSDTFVYIIVGVVALLVIIAFSIFIKRRKNGTQVTPLK